MKNLFKFLAILGVFLPSLAIAQVQGSTAAKGLNGPQPLGVVNNNVNQINGATDGVWGQFAVSATGAQICAIDNGFVVNQSRAITKAEDAAHASSDVGVMSLGVRNDSAATVLTNTNGDYSGIAVDSNGKGFSRIMSSDSRDGVLVEDNVAGSAEGGIVALAKTQDPIAIDQDNNGDYAQLKTTRGGKLQVAFAPATEYWKSCGTATGVTSDVAIKAAVASNKIYVSTISCKNTSTTQNSNLDFKDGSTTFAEGSIGAFVTGTSQPGTFTQQFPVPAQITSATAFNFATNTATSSVTCCASGFISVD